MAPISKAAVLILLVSVYRANAQDNSTLELEKGTNFFLPKSCADPQLKALPSGVRKIQPQPGFGQAFEVYCDQKYDKGGWTSIAGGSKFWLGLPKLNELTYSQKFELVVLMSDWEGISAYARYSHILVAGAEEDYKLNSLGTYSGTAGDSLSWGVGMKWSTLDKENDISPTENCAVDYKGAWWYTGCHYK
ncbi:techylectin-5B [Culex quinquefasciatus]|uniref:Techylectin-5B n=1 Tax=Culex quinquefasciatus TaxID=7176 RepID=B0WNA8_CULQU|nr:techylectin-5B [Culex quinquefasciatus]|eukprot:XP_001850192.1 techylectin-5B [Culex quinquefasciatus]